MILRCKVQRLNGRRRNRQPQLKLSGKFDPTDITACRSVRNQPEGLAPVTPVGLHDWLHRFPGFQIDGHLLNAKRRTKLHLHCIGGRADHDPGHRELDEQPRQCWKQQPKFMCW